MRLGKGTFLAGGQGTKMLSESCVGSLAVAVHLLKGSRPVGQHLPPCFCLSTQEGLVCFAGWALPVLLWPFSSLWGLQGLWQRPFSAAWLLGAPR